MSAKPMPWVNAREHLETHFEDMEKQTHAAIFGMWVFLATEVLFFGVLFTVYAYYRVEFQHTFALAAQHTDLDLGTLGTYLLLTASFLVAMAVGAIRAGRNRRCAWFLYGAAFLGVAFLAAKFGEWGHHFSEGILPGPYYHFEGLQLRGARAFFTLYYVMTGLHAVHVTAGVIILGVLGRKSWKGNYGSGYNTPIEVGGMYWHFVDVVWLFLWPFFYLMR